MLRGGEMRGQQIRHRQRARLDLHRGVIACAARPPALAREITDVAAELGLRANPSAVQRLQIGIDATDAGVVAPFWQAAFRFDQVAPGLLADPLGRQPRLWFQQLDAPRPLRNRIHLDAGTPWELVAGTTDALRAAGGRITYENRWWRTICDAEGNEADVFPLAAAPGTFDTPGADDWRVMLTAAVYYPTTSFLQGVDLLETVSALADDAGLPLLIDLRYPGPAHRGVRSGCSRAACR